MSKNKKIEIWLTGLTIVSFCAFVLGIVISTRKPLCIDSKMIDKINMGQDSVLYRCSIQKGVPLYGYLSEKGNTLASLVRAEKFLTTLSPFVSRLKINILPEEGWTYRLQNETLTLNRNLLESEGVPEKAIIKTWLRDLNPEYFYNDLLAEEVFSDLFLTMIQGQFKLEDPFEFAKTSSAKLSLKHQKWPTVMKTVSGYCHSEWKIAEHYQMCFNLNKNEGTVGNELMDLSLRPLLSSVWIGIYSRLNLKEKIELSKALTQIIKQLKLDKNFHFNALRSSPDEPMVGLFLSVQRLNRLWTNSYQQLQVPTYRHLMTIMASELEAKGFKQVMDVVEFDLVYSSDEILQKQSPRIRAMLELAQKNPNLRILLRDPEKAWFMPSLDPVSIKVIHEIKTQKMVLETCSKVDFTRVMDFSKETSRLLVIRTCDPQKPLNFQKFIFTGAEGFALQNKKISFVQFHLPSVMIKRQELTTAGDVFRFVGQRKIDSPSFQSLGWQHLEWSEQSQAFRPKGFVDAIELFRVFPQETSISNL
jgi:hypothetical protein